MDVPLQAKMLAEMDEEFGIADLISEVVQEDKNKVIITCACGAYDDHVMCVVDHVTCVVDHVMCGGSCDVCGRLCDMCGDHVWWIM